MLNAQLSNNFRILFNIEIVSLLLYQTFQRVFFFKISSFQVQVKRIMKNRKEVDLNGILA